MSKLISVLSRFPFLATHQILQKEFQSSLYGLDVLEFYSNRINLHNPSDLLYLARGGVTGLETLIEAELGRMHYPHVDQELYLELLLKLPPSSSIRKVLCFNIGEHENTLQLAYSAKDGRLESQTFINHSIQQEFRSSHELALFTIQIIHDLGFYVRHVLSPESIKMATDIYRHFVISAIRYGGIIEAEKLLKGLYFLGLDQTSFRCDLAGCIDDDLREFIDPIVLYFLGILSQSALKKLTSPEAIVLKTLLKNPSG